MSSEKGKSGTSSNDWARSPSAIFASAVLGIASLGALGLAVARDFQRDSYPTQPALVHARDGAIAGDGSTLVLDARPARPSAVRLIDVNRADLGELDLLPGIGPALGQRIIDYRAQNGPFESIDSIQGVSGIGPRTIEKLRPLVTLGEAGGYTTDN